MPDPLTILSAASAGAGLLGQLFGGGQNPSQTMRTTRQLSPQQIALLQQLQGELGNELDLGGIVGATRERIGNESSGLRQAALGRLQRAGVSPLQQESALADITTTGLRELGSTIANLEFMGQQSEQSRRLDIFRQLSGMLQGTGTTTQTMEQDPGTGMGFASLFGAGLQGLFRSSLFKPQQPGGNNRGVGNFQIGNRLGG